MKRRRPFKLITGYRKEQAEESFYLGIPCYTRYDVLECGHEHMAVFLPKPSRSPYRHQDDGTVLRRCNDCPLEELS
jgi:hypothetical protein